MLRLEGLFSSCGGRRTGQEQDGTWIWKRGDEMDGFG
jgi:hypothetical protein